MELSHDLHRPAQRTSTVPVHQSEGLRVLRARGELVKRISTPLLAAKASRASAPHEQVRRTARAAIPEEMTAHDQRTSDDARQSTGLRAGLLSAGKAWEKD